MKRQHNLANMDYTIIIIAGVGGFVINLLNIFEAATLSKDMKPDFKDPLYWASYPIGAFLGAGLVYLYVISGFDIKPILAVHLGASSPPILRAMTSIIPQGYKPKRGA